MGFIKVSEVEPGMVLASPVFNPQGAMLLQRGTTITAKHIMLLKAWGVPKVDIEGIERKEISDLYSPELDREELLSRQKSLEARFAGALDDEIMAEIFRIAKKQLVEGALLS
jgi:hypothetical protein